jgi:hypothetical protein
MRQGEHTEMSNSQNRLTPEILRAITQRYDTDRLLVSTAYADGGTNYLRGRLEGGLINQVEAGDAMAARYAIWANTVRDNIIAGMNALKAGEPDEGYRHLVRAANSLSAFSDAQAYLDPLNMGNRSEVK